MSQPAAPSQTTNAVVYCFSAPHPRSPKPPNMRFWRYKGKPRSSRTLAHLHSTPRHSSLPFVPTPQHINCHLERALSFCAPQHLLDMPRRDASNKRRPASSFLSTRKLAVAATTVTSALGGPVPQSIATTTPAVAHTTGITGTLHSFLALD